MLKSSLKKAFVNVENTKILNKWMKNVLIKTFDNGTSKRLIEMIYSIAAVNIYFTPSSEWGEGLLIMESSLPKTFSSILLTFSKRAIFHLKNWDSEGGSK